MKQAPIKQIYLITIIIVGIISLSLYSTYAVFTLEEETSDIVSIHTPNSIKITEELSEYHQLTIEGNSSITTDVDIYNTFSYELCYRIWYKVAGTTTDKNKIHVYETNTESLSSSGSLESMKSKRITLMIINDNEEPAKVNFGISSGRNEGTCSLNMPEDKSLVNTYINNPKKLTESIMQYLPKEKNINEGYLIYDKKNEITLDKNSLLYLSENFNYHEEQFTLTNPIEVSYEDIKNYINTDKELYTCIDKTDCEHIIKIKRITETQNDIQEKIYTITSYDYYVGYLSGKTGIRKTGNNYYFYGDNPDNFIYYNCTDETNKNTCELWRIVGAFYDISTNKYYTKIIRNDSLGKYQYNELTDITYKNSDIYKYFDKKYEINTGYIGDINYYQTYIDKDIETINQEKTIEENIKSPISIITYNDYLNASECVEQNIKDYDNKCHLNNWLNMYEGSSWTLTAYYNEEAAVIELPKTEEIKEPETELEEQTDAIEIETENIPKEEPKIETKTVKNILLTGNNFIYDIPSKEHELHPTIFIKDRVFLVSGEGTKDNPYIIK